MLLMYIIHCNYLTCLTYFSKGISKVYTDATLWTKGTWHSFISFSKRNQMFLFKNSYSKMVGVVLVKTFDCSKTASM